MALLNWGKEEEKAVKSACGCNVPAEEKNYNRTSENAGIQTIKVLGSGCKSCHEMYKNAKKALENAGIHAEAEYVTDMEKVMAYGIMSMPGLVINEQVVSIGKVLKPADIEKLLKTRIEQR